MRAITVNQSFERGKSPKSAMGIGMEHKVLPIMQKLAANTIVTLHDFGYSDADPKNIFTDKIYARFFKDDLLSKKGVSSSTNIAISVLINMIDKEI